MSARLRLIPPWLWPALLFLFPAAIAGAEALPNCLAGDCRQGTGVVQEANGNRYEGQFLDGRYEGQGALTTQDGWSYVGQFRAGQFVGQNLPESESAPPSPPPTAEAAPPEPSPSTAPPLPANYSGAYQNGQYHGQGRLLMASGGVYEGHFVAGKFSGAGRLTMADGSRYVGNFKNNKFDGQGVLYDPAGKIVAKGRWRKGKR